MKATVKYTSREGKARQKTFEVEKNEPNGIVQKFIQVTNESKSTYVKTIKCGNKLYMWEGDAMGAFCTL